MARHNTIPCKVEGCGRLAHSRDMCGKHYRRWHLHGDPQIVNPANRTHGMSRTPEHTVWKAMKKRCHSPSGTDYQHYGGRGISVCDRWRSSFANFFADMGPRPSLGHSIDRIDNDGNYEPGNCRWATRDQQARNKRTTHWVIFGGERMVITDACRLAGMVRSTVNRALARGTTIEEALTSKTPLSDKFASLRKAQP